MQVVVIRSPKLLSGVLRAVFKIKKEEKPAAEEAQDE